MSSLWFFLGALLLMGAAMGVWLVNRPREPAPELLARLQIGAAQGASPKQAEGGRTVAEEGPVQRIRFPLGDRLEAYLRQAGYEVRPYALRAVPVGLLLALLLGLFTKWILALAFLLLLYPAGLWLHLRRRIGKRRAQMILDLPTFLDGVVRVTRIGASLPAALLAATKDATGPVKDLFVQVIRRQQAGLSLDQAMRQVGDFYQIRELRLVASVLRLNARYGGRTDVVLARIADWLRSRVAAQAEFAALSAETRLSAWMLSLLVPGLAVFIILYNVTYIAHMWTDPVGKWILVGAFALLASGVLLLLRMSKLR